MKKSQRKYLASGLDAVLAAMAKMGHEGNIEEREGRIETQARTQSRTLARIIAQGIVINRMQKLPMRLADLGREVPEGIEEAVFSSTVMHESGLRESDCGLLELAGLAWQAMSRADAQDGIEHLIPIPSRSPFIGLRLDGKLREQIQREKLPVMGTATDYAWYVEVDRPQEGEPRGIACWVVEDQDKEAKRIRYAGVWTTGEDASVANPLVISTSRNVGEEPDWKMGATRALTPESEAVLTDIATTARGRADILQKTFSTLAAPAIEHYLHGHGENEKPRNMLSQTMGSQNVPGSGSRSSRHLMKIFTEQPLAQLSVAKAKVAPPSWTQSQPRTALDAILLSAARDATSARGAGEKIWTKEWWSQAEFGAIMWQVAARTHQDGEIVQGRHRRTQVDLDKALKEECALAVRMMNTIVFRTLSQTGRNTTVHPRGEEEIQALLVPRRLWDAIRTAGSNPELPDVPEEGRIWYVEIERPSPGEPNAVCLNLSPSTRIEHVIGIWIDGPHASKKRPLVVVIARERQGSNEATDHVRMGGGLRLAGNEPELDAHAAELISVLKGQDGVVNRVKSAIGEHLDRGELQKLSLRPRGYQERELGKKRRKGQGRGQGSMQEPTESSIFALVRAPDPVAPDKTPTAGRDEHGAGGKQLQERQTVQAHWKRQRYGPKGGLRKLILVEEYERGPEPGEDEMPLLRMAERQELNYGIK